MRITHTITELNNAINQLRTGNLNIGFVPTMGALHQGHLSLIDEAKEKTDIIITSIFVNPTQFDNKEDLVKYPNTIESDIKLLEKQAKCDILFCPNANEMYQDSISSDHYDFGGIENQMEGKFRKGHFDGVATIVKKFFEIVNPDFAFFGEKDFQQLEIVKKMVQIEKLNLQIIGCPIFREKDGLAMSSRNIRLNESQRNDAPTIYKILKQVKTKSNLESIENINKFVLEKFSQSKELELEYFEISNEKTLEKTNDFSNSRAFIAAFAGDIRLIDNIKLQ